MPVKRQMPRKIVKAGGRDVDVDTAELEGPAPTLELTAMIGGIELRETHTIGAADGRGSGALDVADEQAKLDAHRQDMAMRAERMDRAKQIGSALT
jgi:hypothetical protein